MADVKWIKITVNIFDDEKILLIESLPDADSIIVIWFKLLCLAGKQNNHGVFMLNDSIPYTDEMLATIFRRKVTTVKMALETFERFGMIARIDGAVTIPNWGKHQSLDQLENRQEYMRKYMRNYRQKQKNLTCKVYDESNNKSNVSPLEEDKNKKENKNINYQLIADMYNEICISFPRLTKLSDRRKKTIRARMNQGYITEDFKRLFEMAETSSFLKGGNGRDWSASFDWLIQDANMAKVLDGNYQDRKEGVRDEQESGSSVKLWD